MKKLVLFLLSVCVSISFAAAAFAAPLTDAQARSLLQKLVREGHKIEDLWAYEAVFSKGVKPELYDPDNVKYYPVDRAKFPYKTVRAFVADTKRVFSRTAIDEMGIFKLAPRYKDVDGIPCAVYLGQDGDPREMKWFTRTAEITHQSQTSITARVKRIQMRSGKESWALLRLDKENGVWKLGQSSYADGAEAAD